MQSHCLPGVVTAGHLGAGQALGEPRARHSKVPAGWASPGSQCLSGKHCSLCTLRHVRRKYSQTPPMCQVAYVCYFNFTVLGSQSDRPNPEIQGGYITCPRGPWLSTCKVRLHVKPRCGARSPVQSPAPCTASHTGGEKARR